VCLSARTILAPNAGKQQSQCVAVRPGRDVS
jgi:hypothetical protein